MATAQKWDNPPRDILNFALFLGPFCPNLPG